MIQPRFTAETILGTKGKGSFQLVQELGFADIAIGATGIVSIFSGSWVMPSAIAGCLFYGCAGIRHAARAKRNVIESTAMWSDLFVPVVLVVYIITQTVPPVR